MTRAPSLRGVLSVGILGLVLLGGILQGLIGFGVLAAGPPPPRTAQGWLELGRMAETAADWPLADRAYTMALGLTDRRPEILEEFGEMKTREARGQVRGDAIALFAEAVRRKPRSYKALYFLGLAWAQHHEMAHALRIWQVLRAVAPPGADWVPKLDADIRRAESFQQGQAGNPP